MTDHPDSVRLNKFIAEKLGLSRRKADELIEQGRVLLNGTSPELGSRVVPGVDLLAVDDRDVNTGETTTFIYLALNKPIGYVSSRRQQGENRTIYALLPEKYHALKPVGRLDKDSSGLLLLTNDGDFAHQMTHPKFYKVKKYEVTLNTPLQPLHKQMINDYGVSLPDGPSKLQLERMHDGDDTQWRIIMSEGRNRQIRRTFESLGYTVTRLHRTDFGPYTLSELGENTFAEVIKK
jgi:23S rRNA pseudouridine2605 synthase